MTDILIEGGETLLGNGFAETRLHLADGVVAGLDAGTRRGLRLDARGLLVLPGIVDIHGDAFERQMMPRPGVHFPIDVALLDSDRQAIANGMTTVFHATTWSWEPGLRGANNARLLADAIEAMRPQLGADTRLHLRHETFNLEAEDDIVRWLATGRIGLLAFNDHTPGILKKLDIPGKLSTFLERTGLSADEFSSLARNVASRADEVPVSMARIAVAARAAKVKMLSHDDTSPAMRQAMRAMGIAIAEFPINEETARDAVAHGDDIVFGAPNVVRGGSHTGWTKAADMIAKGLCSILASDYYYPAPLLSAFRLVEDGILPLEKAWDLISAAPARAAGLTDRGRLVEGARADIALIDGRGPRPRVVAVIARGRLVFLSEGTRISASIEAMASPS